jgi:hypothetical protein
MVALQKAAEPVKAVAPVKGKAPVDMSQYLSSSAKHRAQGDIVIHAPPKNGKTFFAASASEAYPDELDPEAPAVLEDMLWFSVDAGACAGFEEAGLECPNVINVNELIADLGPIAGVEAALKLAKQVKTSNPKIRYNVVDTVSQLDRYWTAHFGALRAGEENTYALFRDIFNAHKLFHSNVLRLGLRNIWLCHSKAVAEGNTIQAKNSQRAQKVPGIDAIQPDITGQARTVYIGNASLELVILAKISPKDRLKMRWTVYPYGGHGFEGSNRYHQSLELEEEANLRKILAKTAP